MSGITAYSCCCETGVTYYAEKCEAYTDDYCCDLVCCSGPERIEFCESYLTFIGIPLPLDPTKCYFVAYLNCVYEVKGTLEFPCPPGSGLFPLNVGTLLEIRDKGEGPCCVPKEQEQVPPGGIADLEVEGNPVITEPTNPCEDVIAECYLFCDQFGTNAAGCDGPAVTSTLTACYIKWGLDWNGGLDDRDCVCCDRDFPLETYAPVTKAANQRVGICIPDMSQVVQTLIPGTQSGVYFQSQVVFGECPDCPAALGYCCIEGDICELDPTLCDNYENPLLSYDLFTYYSLVTGGVSGCVDDVRDALVIRFPFCMAQAASLDPFSSDPVEQEAVRQFYLALVNVTNWNDPIPCTVNTGWGVLPATCVDVCDYRAIVFSGNPGHVAQRINDRLAPFITAQGQGFGAECFWFANRQSCNDCGGGPNQRPPFSAGDRLEVDRAVIDVASQQVFVWLVGRSVRYRACVCQDFTPRQVIKNVVNVAISAECLSPAEYSCNARYSMLPVSQEGTVGLYCRGDGLPEEEYPECEEIPWSPEAVWPLEDIEVFDPISGTWVVLVYGYESICNLCSPSTNCRVYPLKFPTFSCEECNSIPPNECPELCQEVYYDPKTFCETSATPIQLL